MNGQCTGIARACSSISIMLSRLMPCSTDNAILSETSEPEYIRNSALIIYRIYMIIILVTCKV